MWSQRGSAYSTADGGRLLQPLCVDLDARSTPLDSLFRGPLSFVFPVSVVDHVFRRPFPRFCRGRRFS